MSDTLSSLVGGGIGVGVAGLGAALGIRGDTLRHWGGALGAGGQFAGQHRGLAIAGIAGTSLLVAGSAEAGRVKTISELVNGISGLSRSGRGYRGERILHQLVDESLQNPRALLGELRNGERLALRNDPDLGRRLFGRALERQVARRIGDRPELDRLFRYVQQDSKGIPEFAGRGPLHGMRFDLTTDTPREIARHRRRSPRARLILYPPR